MSNNKNLNAAMSAKHDEFYTQLSDVEKEMKYYKKYFENKTVLCNCNDSVNSSFFKYFALNFNYLKLKRLICVSYVNNIRERNYAYKIDINAVSDTNNDGCVDLNDVLVNLNGDNSSLTILNGNGDFRSDECIDILTEADIVVTNPPFSLFKEFINQLVEYDKKFIVLGNQNAIGYNGIFKLIKDERL